MIHRDHHNHHYSSIVFFPPPPLQFYCFLSTTTITFLMFFLQHHISIVSTPSIYFPTRKVIWVWPFWPEFGLLGLILAILAWWKKFKIKRLAGGCDENLRLQKHRRERQIIDRSFDGNFGEFEPFLWDLWGFELGRSALESPAFPFFLLLVQLKILNVDKTASKWLFWRRDSKTQNKNTR